MKVQHRGRPKDNDVEVLQYTQIFKFPNGQIQTWVWDKIRHPRGPISVEIEYPKNKFIDSLEKEKADIINKYMAVPGERKPRIQKKDKLKLEELEKLINKEYDNN